MLAALVPSEAVRRGSIPGRFPRTWRVLTIPGVCESLPPISAFICAWLSPCLSPNFPFLQGRPSYWIRGPLYR